MQLKSVLVIISFLLPAYACALDLNYIINLKKDGSGTLNLIYSESESIIASKNSMVGVFPFTKDGIEKVFSVSKNTMLTSKVGKSEQDKSSTEVNIVLSFTEISNLSEIQALSLIKPTSAISDSGRVVTVNVSPSFVSSNFVNKLYVILKSEEEIFYSSDGKIVDRKRAEWFRGDQYLKTGKHFNFVAVMKSDAKTTSSNGNTSSDDKSNKSCGLFGFELPLILFGWVLLIRRKIK